MGTLRYESCLKMWQLINSIKFPIVHVTKKKMLKCTVVQALRLCTGRTAHRGSRGITLTFHDHGTKREWGSSFTPRPLFTSRKYPVPTVQEAGWAPGPVWTGAENFAPTGIRSPYRQARSQSLYRLSYRGPQFMSLSLSKFSKIKMVFLFPSYMQTFSYPYNCKNNVQMHES